MFEFIKKAIAASRLSEEQIYDEVLEEIENGIQVRGVWAKALADAAGNTEQTRALYIKYRVQSIKDEDRLTESILQDKQKLLTQHDHLGNEQALLEREMVAVNRLEEMGYTVKKVWRYWIVIGWETTKHTTIESLEGYARSAFNTPSNY